MGFLDERERQRSRLLRRRQRVVSITFKTIFLMFVAVLLCVMAAIVAVDLGGISFLKWIDQHPAFAARYNPHHWLSRGIALLVIFLLAQKVWLVLSLSVKRLIIWCDWWRKPSTKEPEQPVT